MDSSKSNSLLLNQWARLNCTFPYIVNLATFMYAERYRHVCVDIVFWKTRLLIIKTGCITFGACSSRRLKVAAPPGAVKTPLNLASVWAHNGLPFFFYYKYHFILQLPEVKASRWDGQLYIFYPRQRTADFVMHCLQLLNCHLHFNAFTGPFWLLQWRTAPNLVFNLILI